VEKPCCTSVFTTFALSVGPEEGRFADPTVLARCWPAEGTIVALPHTWSPPAIFQ
jgi:hypothetical protein